MAIVATELGGGRNSKKELQTKGLSEIDEFNRRQLERINNAFTPQTEPAWPGSPQLVPKGEGLKEVPAVYQTKPQPQGTAEALGLGSARAEAPTAAPASTAPEVVREAVPEYQKMTYSPAQGAEDYINKLYDAQKEASLASLRSAYEQNRSTVENQRNGLAERYEGLRNAAAGEADRQRQAFNEYAAARGLSSGAHAQAELSGRNALLGSLDNIRRDEANANRDIDSQLAQLETQYRSAAAQAAADGDIARMQALYNEWVRVQDEGVKMQQLNAQEAQNEYNALYQQYRDAVSDDQFERQFALTKAKSTASSGGASGGATGNTASTGIIQNMLNAGSDAAAYEYLLGLGYNNDKTSQLWAFYNEAKSEADSAGENRNIDNSPGYSTPSFANYDDVMKYIAFLGTQAGDGNVDSVLNGLLTMNEFNGARSGLNREMALYHPEVNAYSTYTDYINRYLSDYYDSLSGKK